MTRVLVFSVGGGDAERNVSANIVRALELGREAVRRSSASSGATVVSRPQVADAAS